MQNAHIFQKHVEEVQSRYIDLSDIVLQFKRNPEKRSFKENHS